MRDWRPSALVAAWPFGSPRWRKRPRPPRRQRRTSCLGRRQIAWPFSRRPPAASRDPKPRRNRSSNSSAPKDTISTAPPVCRANRVNAPNVAHGSAYRRWRRSKPNLLPGRRSVWKRPWPPRARPRGAAGELSEPAAREVPMAARAQPSASDSSVPLDLPPEAILSPPGTHPMAELFTRFWAARAEGSRVEVHLATGGVLLPDAYIETPSQPGHAVLVSREPDGSHTVTLVPWESVVRVILRGIRQVPGQIVE